MPRRLVILTSLTVSCVILVSTVAFAEAGGEELIASTTMTVAPVTNVIAAQSGQVSRSEPAPAFLKLQRKIIPREIVWFNGREGDLERHAFVRRGRTYLTLTDLMRHIGGTIIWGPSESYIEVHRNEVTIRTIPGSSIVYVNGQKTNLGHPATQRGGRTFVPLRLYCDLFGLHTDWNELEGRAYVTFREK